MRKLLFSLFLLNIAFHAFSQDKIYLTDNSVVNGKVSEIGLTEIKYKKFDNLTGPDYVMPKSKITMIIYENGTHEVINSTAVHTQEENATLLILPYYETGKNLIGVNYFDLIFKNVTLNYTRFLCNYRFSLNASASLGFTNSNDYYSGNNSFLNFDRDYFHSAFSFNYFPIGMNKVSYFTGLTLMTGKGGEYIYDYDGRYLVDRNYYGFYVTNGVQFNLSKHFNMRTSLNLGLVDRDMNGDFQSHAMFELSAGIRF